MIERKYTIISDTKVIQHRRINFGLFYKKMKDRVFEKKAVKIYPLCVGLTFILVAIPAKQQKLRWQYDGLFDLKSEKEINEL